MKQMKRAAGLLLALVLVLSMAACGKKDGDGGDSQSGFQRGTIENGIYTNTFVGIGCQLSDDWTYYTDEQLAELSGVVAESSEEMQKAIDMLSEVKESIINAYEIKTGLSRAKLSHLMDAETWMNANKAVELGFADDLLFKADGESAAAEDSFVFSRRAVTNSLMSKVKSHHTPSEPAKSAGTPISELEKRLALIKP